MGKMLGGEEEKDPDAQKKEEERQEALRQQEEERKAKYAKMEAERENIRQGIRDKVAATDTTASQTVPRRVCSPESSTAALCAALTRSTGLCDKSGTHLITEINK